jgi:hypothetical protein
MRYWHLAQRQKPKKGRSSMPHDQTPYFMGWGTLSLVNAGLAQAKGRSGLVWWLISLLLGPIATFLIVVFPPALGPPGVPFAGKAVSEEP